MKRFLSLSLAVLMLFCVLWTPSFAASASPAAGKVNTGTSNLNIRAGASTGSAIVGKLKNGTWITLLSKEGNWWKVRYNEKNTGYCSADYITVRQDSFHTTVSTGGGNLNVRKGAGTSYDVKAKLPDGASVAVLSQTDGWSHIVYHGTTLGYVASGYLKANAGSSQAISFNVPRYAQTDSRWSSVRIGTSGGTIGTIGCTTTCLAMTESYRKGTTVTPKTMASSLSYMAGGALYWPSGYATALATSDPVNQILSVLKTGKPVIFGSKKANGTQHWCVVTGWNGKSVTASAFSINDPATSSRTTLADFFAVYPNAYKLAWYK